MCGRVHLFSGVSEIELAGGREALRDHHNRAKLALPQKTA
jgi:hypothetical protein